MLILENLRYVWSYLWSGRTPAIVLGVLFAFLAIGLFIASRTRWGKAKPLTKCVVLSVIAHIWLLLYASGTPVALPQGDPNGARDSMAVSLDATRLEPAGPTASLDTPPTEESAIEAALPVELSPWERPLDSSQLTMPDVMEDAPGQADMMTSADLLSSFEPTPLPDLPPLPDAAAPEIQLPSPDSGSSTILPPLEMENGSAALRTVSSKSLPSPSSEIPAEYQLRVSSDRLELARPFGADADTEAAVAAALNWLAKVQSSDGSWNARQHGGGTETFALGENRNGTGDRADTGVTGLALLAFLSGGHTHRTGEHQAVVMRGLQYLMQAQMPGSGDLSGPKQVGHDPSVLNARMYCHGIAMLALAEAYAMTHDPELRPPLMLAIGYTMQAQDSATGGWRYRPGDAGDLSQFGWQAMALRSAERSGIRLDPNAKQRMLMFLDSCAAGPARGLARYRPREGAPSPTMTAEALACRYLLNHRGTAASQIEARNYLMANLPDNSEANVYYWYYATLALFQMQGESWQRWNLAMKTTLVGTQKPAYDAQGGSWDPDKLWGGYGGRVYSTAMSCLCLEVYYRYLPLYQ